MQPGMTPTPCAMMPGAEMPTNLVADPSNAAAFEESTSEEPTSLGTLTCEGALVEAAFAELRLLLGAKRYSLWFEGKIGLAVRDDLLTVAVGSPFLLNWMQKQFKEITTEAARVVLGPSARVAFAVDATRHYVLSPDLGADRIFVHRFYEASRGLTEGSPPAEVTPPGSGPRRESDGRSF